MFRADDHEVNPYYCREEMNICSMFSVGEPEILYSIQTRPKWLGWVDKWTDGGWMLTFLSSSSCTSTALSNLNWGPRRVKQPGEHKQ